eukprot:TRINITY_DN1141_c0_g1_i7.p1 TRINITY_DN1141_c0_g1~~TRINITY_DN1141_c0_g1_i7.p1  ORF type:complete len:237 (-),score=58.51 TRINITY_DN1141_c0_g1_i7:10-720(-)
MSINDQLLVNNLKHLLRHLRSNHEDFLRLKNMKTNQNPQMLDILQCIMSINIIMQKKLSTAAEEKKSHINQIQDLSERINQLTESKENQVKDLEKIKKQRKQFQDEKREEIEKYKKGLEDVKQRKHDKIKQLELKTTQTLEQLKKEYDLKKNKLEESLKTAMNEFNTLLATNKKIEDQTLKKNKQGKAVSYTHLTLPTKRIVQISVVAVSLKKKKVMLLIGRWEIRQLSEWQNADD